ncbi:MAG: hypothetical protein KF903_04800 [Dokdonella sp.]|nr:hypothetical protein [Dokdonella sp.]MBX3700301.1 hypothetical protein [Dokdonella sp.]
MKSRWRYTLLAMTLAVTGCADSGPPPCSDPGVLEILANTTTEGELAWTPKDIQTLDWDDQTARLAGLDRGRDIRHLNSCAAILVPSKDKVWVAGQTLEPSVRKNMEMMQRTADQQCSGEPRPGMPSDPAANVLCQRLQEAAKQQQARNRRAEEGYWEPTEPRRIRYVTGRFDDGRVSAAIILQ